MKENNLARRYAKGLVQTLKDEKEYVLVHRELSEFSRLLKADPRLKAGLETLLHSPHQKQEILEIIKTHMGLHAKSSRFLEVILDENRLVLLDLILEQLETVWFAAQGIERITVASVVELDAGQRRSLSANLEKAFGKKIHLQNEIDPRLIAGIRIKKGSLIYDFSLQDNLRQLRRALVGE